MILLPLCRAAVGGCGAALDRLPPFRSGPRRRELLFAPVDVYGARPDCKSGVITTMSAVRFRLGANPLKKPDETTVGSRAQDVRDARHWARGRARHDVAGESDGAAPAYAQGAASRGAFPGTLGRVGCWFPNGAHIPVDESSILSPALSARPRAIGSIHATSLHPFPGAGRFQEVTP